MHTHDAIVKLVRVLPREEARNEKGRPQPPVRVVHNGHVTRALVEPEFHRITRVEDFCDTGEAVIEVALVGVKQRRKVEDR